MNAKDAVVSGFRNYINFNGRAGRSEFWWFFLFALVSTMVLIWVPFLGWLYALAMLLPTLAAMVRRLHDRDQSGWWAIAWFLPFVNWALLIYLAFPGTPGPNRYGPDPLQQWGWPGQGSPQPGAGQPAQGAQQPRPGHPYQPGALPGGGVPPPASTPPPGGENAAPANPPAADARSFCTQCGTQLADGARFCSLCGTAV